MQYVYLTKVDEASCRLLIMLGDGLRYIVLGNEVFSQRIDPMLLQELFQTPFCNNNYIFLNFFKKIYRPVARQKHTRYANRK